MGSLDLVLLLIIIFYVITCPYTKVEESFNIQAIYDILNFGVNIDAYDHLQFPGVVPRTFIGALLVSIVSFPITSLMQASNMITGLQVQTVCRLTLGTITWIGFVLFRASIKRSFGSRTSQLFLVLTILQFHLCFYASRTLPNTFALISCLLSFSLWLEVIPIF